jgi:hypothetical protein
MQESRDGIYKDLRRFAKTGSKEENEFSINPR